jgi:hypothetical protein
MLVVWLHPFQPRRKMVKLKIDPKKRLREAQGTKVSGRAMYGMGKVY